MSVRRRSGLAALGPARLVGAPAITAVQTIYLSRAGGGDGTSSTPSSVAVNDLYLVWMFQKSTGSSPVPSSTGLTFTTISQENGASVSYAFSPDTTPRAITTTGFAGSIDAAMIFSILRGVHTSDPIDVEPVATSGTGTTTGDISIASMTNAYRNSRSIAAVGGYDDWTIGSPADWTTLSSQNIGTAGSIYLGIRDAVLGATGAATLDLTTGASASYYARALSLRAAGD